MRSRSGAHAPRPAWHLLAVLPVLAGFSTVGALHAVGPSAVGCASAATEHHVALVIEHGNGSTLTYCVGFTAASMTGEQLLNASGVEVQYKAYGGYGNAVCQLDNEPSSDKKPTDNCPGNPYWELFVSRGGGGWTSSSLGVSSQAFADGDAVGLRFNSDSSSAVPPSPAGICPPPATPTPIPTARATPRATSHPAAVSTRAPAAISASSPAPSPSPSAEPTFTAGITVTHVSGTPAGAALVVGSSSLGPVLGAAGLAIGLLALMVVQLVRRRGGSEAGGPT